MTSKMNKDNKDIDNNNKYVTKEELNTLIKNFDELNKINLENSINELRREAEESKKEINDNFNKMFMMLGNKNITRRTSGIHPFDNLNTPDKSNLDKDK
jgi:hypothetical protein